MELQTLDLFVERALGTEGGANVGLNQLGDVNDGILARVEHLVTGAARLAGTAQKFVFTASFTALSSVAKACRLVTFSSQLAHNQDSFCASLRLTLRALRLCCF